jgi:hypothetical protein
MESLLQSTKVSPLGDLTGLFGLNRITERQAYALWHTRQRFVSKIRSHVSPHNSPRQFNSSGLYRLSNAELTERTLPATQKRHCMSGAPTWKTPFSTGIKWYSWCWAKHASHWWVKSPEHSNTSLRTKPGMKTLRIRISALSISPQNTHQFDQASVAHSSERFTVLRANGSCTLTCQFELPKREISIEIQTASHFPRTSTKLKPCLPA